MFALFHAIYSKSTDSDHLLFSGLLISVSYVIASLALVKR